MTPAPAPVVEVFFDFACPWSFVAFNRAKEAAMRTLATVEWRPLERQALRGKFADLQPVSPLELDQQRIHWQAWLKYCGLSSRLPLAAEIHSRQALLATLYATEYGAEAAFIAAVFHACWTEALDIADPSVLGNLAAECGLNTEELAEWLQKPAVAAALDRNSDEFAALKGYATPGFRIGQQLFLGNEQMPLVELALGQASDVSFVMPGSHYWPDDETEETIDTTAT
jgi:2-hydroxychromene-2-carboxylate isomerase